MKKILNLILKFFAFIIKEISSLFIKLIVLGIIIIVIATTFLNKKTVEKKGSIVKINFANKWGEKINNVSSIINDENFDFYELLKKLDKIQNDKKIKGLLLELDNLSLDNAQKEEISHKLESIKNTGKFIISYAKNYNNSNYYMALNSTKIIMPPTATAESFITGYFNSLAYMGGLAQKLGVDVHVIHVGDYKAFGENYVKKEMSKEFRENITELKNNNYNNFLNLVSKSRKIDKNKLNEDILTGKYVMADAFSLKDYNIIDELSYLDDIKEKLGNDEIIDINDYNYIPKPEKNKIALIVAQGDITMDSNKNMGINPKTIISEIDIALKDKNIKGIVLRVNSPGGSALASNIIYHKLMNAKLKKPIYVSIGGVAASGGYYISSAGDKIFADSMSTTGSIGVVSILPNFKKIISKTGINMQTIKKGEFSDLYSLTNDFSQKDKEKIYNSSLKIYDEFITIVAKSRNKDKKYIDSIAQGRVYSGKKGLEIGLIDEIGGLTECIANLAKKLNLKNYEVIQIKEDGNIKDMIIDSLPIAKTLNKLEYIMPSHELYLKPIYYFPYNINK